MIKRILDKVKSVLQLQTDLRTILDAKGFTNSENEHLSELIPKVSQISEKAYAVEGTIMLVSNSNTLIINNLPQKPVEVGLICKTLRDANITTSTAEKADFVVCDILALFEEDNANTVNIGDVEVTRAQETSGNWTVTFSSTEEYQFKSGHVYTWVALSHTVVG